jgi:hypothetical protein
MRVLVDIGHPAHVHFFRPVLDRLQAQGHETRVTARDKDVALALLRAFGIEHTVLSRAAATRAGLYLEYPRRLVRLVRLARGWRPDVMVAIGGAFVAPAARLARVPSLVLTDTEHVALDRWLTYPLASRIATPYTFRTRIGSTQVSYRGFQELAYLSPGRFRGDPAVRRELGVGDAEPFVILRIVSWAAGHDVGHSGFRGADLEAALAHLSPLARLLVSAEGRVPPLLHERLLRLEPQRMHAALAEAALYLGEGATMATEAGLLGTPSLYVSSLAGSMGNFQRLADAGLVESFREGGPAVQRAEALLASPGSRGDWRERARRFADDHEDVVAFVLRQLAELGGGRATAARAGA